MTWSYGYFSLTRVFGMLSFVVSFAACIWRWRRCRLSGASSTVFMGLAAVQLGLLADMAFDLRWKLHEIWMTDAMQGGWYGERRGPQLLVLTGIGCLTALGTVLILRGFEARPGASIALLGTFLSVELWLVEAVSLHGVDGVLYRQLGGAMVVSFLWLVLAGVTCAGIWMDGVRVSAG